MGDSVATGYWGTRGRTAVTFPRAPAILADKTGDAPCVRTADEGVVVDSELFLTGRLN